MNNSRKPLDVANVTDQQLGGSKARWCEKPRSGKSSQTLAASLRYIKNKRPAPPPAVSLRRSPFWNQAIVILENVLKRSTEFLLVKELQQLSYVVQGFNVNSFSFAVPQSRSRLYVIAVDPCRLEIVASPEKWVEYAQDTPQALSCKPQPRVIRSFQICARETQDSLLSPEPWTKFCEQLALALARCSSPSSRPPPSQFPSGFRIEEEAHRRGDYPEHEGGWRMASKLAKAPGGGTRPPLSMR